MSRPVGIRKPVERYACIARDGAGASSQSRVSARVSARVLAEETPIALVYCESTEAVMMATPADLEDFALGFSLTEGLIESLDEIAELAVIHGEHGIELRMWLAGRHEAAYRNRRRRFTGPTGCGLCGLESLAEAVRPNRRVADGPMFNARHIAEATTALTEGQRLNRETRATHAAGFYQPDGGIAIVREDVGRHNALDKLAGALCRRRIASGGGAIVITSRVSVEMVQKAAAIGSPLLIAVSAPTALAVRTAVEANITLVAVAREQSYQVFAHAWRIG